MKVANAMKALLFDVDQTIQNKEDDTSVEVWDKLADLNRKGILVACITARPFPMCKKILSRINLDAFSVFDNGAYLAKQTGSDRMYERFIDRDLTKELIKRLISLPHLRIGVSARDGFFANENYLTEINEWFGEAGGFRALTEIPRYVYSIWIRDATEDAYRIIRESFLTSAKALVVEESDSRSLFIYSKGVSKVAGLYNFCSANEVGLGEIAFIGDSSEDSEIAKRVAVSAAVKNAHPEMRRIANYRLTKPYSEGFSEFLHILGH